jgi:hypothetical protein
MYVRLRLFVLVLLASVSPSLGSAQQTSAQAAPVSGPQLDAMVMGVRRPSAQSDALNLQRRSQGVGRPVALMIVGGAAVVLGALIGDDVGLLFMIGGAVVLLIGLYRYLQ